MPPTTSSRPERFGNGAGRQEAGLGADHHLIALHLFERGADAALGSLTAIVDGGIEEVDAAFARRDQRVGVGAVGGVILGAEIGADAQAGNFQADSTVR